VSSFRLLGEVCYWSWPWPGFLNQDRLLESARNGARPISIPHELGAAPAPYLANARGLICSSMPPCGG